MIVTLCMRDNFRPLRAYLRAWGKPLRHRVRMLAWEDRLEARRLPDATYLFCDVDRMSPALLETAAALWDALAARGDAVRLLNRPGRSLPRVALLRALHARGNNDFGVRRLDEPREGLRYPVFVRHAREHDGAYTPLCESPQALERELARLLSEGRRPESLLIVEFVDVRERGYYRKYSAFRLGPQSIAHHVFFQREWEVKGPSLFSPEMLEEERIFQETHPHAAQLAEIFELAGIDYGRIDYGIANGRLQVWEINTNPSVLRPRSFYEPIQLPGRIRFVRRFNAAFEALDDRSPSPRIAWWLGRLAQAPRSSREHRRFV